MVKFREKTRLFTDVMGNIIKILLRILSTIIKLVTKLTVKIINVTGTKNIIPKKSKKYGRYKKTKLLIIKKLNARPITTRKLIKKKNN